MIKPKIGGLILLLFPLLPLVLAIITKSTVRRKACEIIFVITIINFIFYSFAYAEILKFLIVESERSYYDDILGKLFLFCFSNILIPLTYYLILLVFYFVFYKRKSVLKNHLQ